MCKHSQILIRLAPLPIANRWVDMPYFLETISSYGLLRNRKLWLVPQPKLNMKSLADTTAEISWLQSLFCELGIFMKTPPMLWCDNIGATYLAVNPVFHARTKHVEIDFHFVRDKIARGDLVVKFSSTKDQLVDLFTKPLSSARF